MSIIESIRERARAKRRKIVFPEGEEPRTIQAAGILSEQDIVKPCLLGDVNIIKETARGLNLSLPGTLQIVNPAQSEKSSDYASELYNLRKQKGMTYEKAREWVRNPLYFGAMMVRRAEADGCVAGAVNTTGDVLRSAIHCVGLEAGISVVSSIFLMILSDGRALTYGDCAVVPYPDSQQLASIAISSADSHLQLTGETPVVAMLSFSTKGSAQHESVDKVLEALELVRAQRPDLRVDGELQFDAALIESVGVRKAPGSAVAGRANVLIFPNLDAGNIGYKITERLAGAAALGPVIQGLAKPVNDLSRGCKVQDIVDVAAICAVKA